MLAFSKWKSIRILGSKTTAHMQQSTAAGRMSVSSCEETAQLLVMIVWLLLNQRLNSNRRNIQKELHPRRCSSLCMIASRDWVGVTLLISCARSWSKSCQWLYVSDYMWRRESGFHAFSFSLPLDDCRQLTLNSQQPYNGDTPEAVLLTVPFELSADWLLSASTAILLELIWSDLSFGRTLVEGFEMSLGIIRYWNTPVEKSLSLSYHPECHGNPCSSCWDESVWSGGSTDTLGITVTRH